MSSTSKKNDIGSAQKEFAGGISLNRWQRKHLIVISRGKEVSSRKINQQGQPLKLIHITSVSSIISLCVAINILQILIYSVIMEIERRLRVPIRDESVIYCCLRWMRKDNYMEGWGGWVCNWRDTSEARDA
jgi:hypothetical protein